MMLRMWVEMTGVMVVASDKAGVLEVWVVSVASSDHGAPEAGWQW